MENRNQCNGGELEEHGESVSMVEKQRTMHESVHVGGTGEGWNVGGEREPYVWWHAMVARLDDDGSMSTVENQRRISVRNVGWTREGNGV